MIIACPACTTGFNLPETHLRTKGAKLRCSKCSHVFRVRLGKDDQPEIFYRDGEEPAPGFGESRERHQTMLGVGSMLDDNPKTVDLDAQMQADQNKLNRTSVGMPRGVMTGGSGLFNLPGGGQSAPFPAAASGPASRGQVSSEEASSPGFNALPSFGETRTDDGQFDFSAVEMPRSATAHGGTLKLFDEPAAQEAASKDDLFEGAFASGADDEFDFDPFTELSTAHEDAAPKKSAPRAESAPILEAGQPLLHPARQQQPPHISQDHGASPPKPKLATAFDFGAIDLPSEDEKKPSAMPMFQSADELVDPNFGMDAQAFDPQQGIIGGPAKAPPQQPSSRPGPGASAGPPLQLDIPGNYVAPPSAGQRPGPGPSAGAPASQAAAREPSLELAPHRIGGSGIQKAANLVLITMIVLMGFFGLVAGLNDGMIDFKNFGHMIDVAFGGKTYSPRPEWRGEATASAAKADEDKDAKLAQPESKANDGPTLRLKAEGTWAQVTDLGRRKQALVVRGRALNQSPDAADAIKARVVIALAAAPAEELASAEAFVGAWLGDKELKKAKDAKSAQALLPEAATTIEPKGDVPFTVIFDEIPAAISDNKEVIYRVELR